MSIEAVCPGCNKSYRLQDTAAGRTVLCKKCGTKFKAPAAPPEDDDAYLDELIDEADSGDDEAEEEAVDIFSSQALQRPPKRTFASKPARGGAKPGRSGMSRTQTGLVIGGAVIGCVLLACCGGVFFLSSLMKPPTASAQAGEPFPVETLRAPVFPELPAPQALPQSGVALYQVDLGAANPGSTQPATRMRMRVYLPPGDHAERSLGCVIVAPAGTNML